MTTEFITFNSFTCSLAIFVPIIPLHMCSAYTYLLQTLPAAVMISFMYYVRSSCILPCTVLPSKKIKKFLDILMHKYIHMWSAHISQH